MFSGGRERNWCYSSAFIVDFTQLFAQRVGLFQKKLWTSSPQLHLFWIKLTVLYFLCFYLNKKLLGFFSFWLVIISNICQKPFQLCQSLRNPFSADALPLKTSEYIRFCNVFRGYRSGTLVECWKWVKNGNIITSKKKQEKLRRCFGDMTFRSRLCI